MVSGPLRIRGSAGSPLIIQLSWAAGFDLPDVQFTLTVSPTWYLGRPPVIFGPSFGRAEINEIPYYHHNIMLPTTFVTHVIRIDSK